MISSAMSEEVYTPPKMFDEEPIKVYKPLASVKPAIEETSFSIKPTNKPHYTPKVIKVTKAKPITKGINIGVTKVIQKTLPIKTPAVESQSLIPFNKSNDDKETYEQTIETTIAFLPASVDLTNNQKSKFKDIINTYFIERNASEIEIRVFATPEASGKQNSAKRRALARGLNVRDWLINLKVKPERITLKAIGASKDDGIPDRADIKILF